MRARLEVDLSGLADNWRDLDGMSAASVETAAVVKADAYGLGAPEVVQALYAAGARTFFVAQAEEGPALGELPVDCRVFVFSGYMDGDRDLITETGLIPVLCSPEQIRHFFEDLPGHRFALQLETGLHRLGILDSWFVSHRRLLLEARPELIVSHLACADEPDNRMNRTQLERFRVATHGCGVSCSLAATGGILLGPSYHFELCRPGIGIYGCLPFAAGRNVVNVQLPVVQVMEALPGDTVGYGATWQAGDRRRIATVLSGYADGIFRHLGNASFLYSGSVPCPVIGRISMDLVTVDITGLESEPVYLQLLGPNQSVDSLAEIASTIGYEVLTRLGGRFERVYKFSTSGPA